MASIQEKLNAAQMEAVHCCGASSLVLAGAGSGKTRVIAHKIAHLVSAGLLPQKIAAITFTNKAANQMRERVKGLIGRKAKDLVICTFHALGVRMLRQDGHHLGLKANFSILDSDDVLALLKDAGGSTDNATARSWQWRISHWKNAGLDVAAALSLAGGASAQDLQSAEAAKVMQRYEERLSAYQSVDFDDLIGLPLKLLRTHEPSYTLWRNAYRHILIDEYQDTNAIQYELLKCLIGERTCFTAVGDDDQSIYGWRGASLDNLRKLPQDFPSLKVIKLEQNYRSTSAILNAANNVIGRNPKLFAKRLWSDLGSGEPVRVVDADDEEHEAQRVLARIQSIRAGQGNTQPQGDYRDFCILYRANHQAKVFEQALRKAAIPYKVSGGTSFFDRVEIKDLCAWLRLLANDDDDPAFIRAVCTPKRGIGHTSLQSLGRLAAAYKVSLFEALFNATLTTALGSRVVYGLHEFGRYVNDLQYRARHTKGQEEARAFLLEWLKEIGYEKHLHETAESETLASTRWQNVLDFVDWMSKRCGGEIDDGVAVTLVSESKPLSEVIQTVSLVSTLSQREGDQNVVTLSTLHAAKGLEWPHVMLVGVTEGTLPFAKKSANPPKQAANDGESSMEEVLGEGEGLARIEEERRLMYVGITRAQRTLMVSYTKRKREGRQRVACEPSRFIAEMALEQASIQEDPLAKIRALRAEFALRSAQQSAQNAAES